MDLPEMVQRLKRIVRLSMLDDEVLADLAVVVTAERCSPGTVICRQGEVEDKFYGLEFGTVLVQATVGDQEIVVAHLSTGDVFGERALTEALPRTATVVAETTVDLLGLHRRDYQRLVQKHPALERILVGPDVVPLLGQVPLFSRLSQEELTELSRHVGVRFYPRGRRVAQQGDMGATMYVVIDGDLVAYQMDESGRRRPVKALGKGDAFGETSLLVGEPRDATVIAKTEAEICYLHKAAFDDFLETRPKVRNKLRVRPDVERKWRAHPFPGQNPDEIIEIRNSKHWVAFLRFIALPALLLILTGVAIVMAYNLWAVGELAWLPISLTILWFLATAAVGTWYWIDWRNDYHIVTSQRVIHIERELLRAATTEVVPIEQVQNVEVRQGLWGSLLDYGHVRVATAGAAGGAVELPFVHEPDAFQQAIFEQIRRARFRAVAEERVEIRQMIRQAIGASELEEVVEEESAPAGKAPLSWLPHLTQSQPVRRLRRIFSEFGVIVFLRHPHLPRQEIRTDDEVIWRKHWAVLLAATYRPLFICLVIAALTGAAVAGWQSWFDLSGILPTLLGWAALFLGLILIAALFWLFWEVEDWRNDQYIVTDTRIIDIARTPFLLNESQRQARLESIENTQSVTQGFWRSLLKLGDVTIETAGEGTFTFMQVRDPAKVQAEIERRREAYRNRVRRQEAERRRAEMIRWLSVYSDVAREETSYAQREAAQQSPKAWVEESEGEED